MIDQMWGQVKDTLYITREQFEKSLEGWTITPFYNPALFGVVMNQGPSFHFMIFGPWKCTKEILRQFPGSLIEKYGYAETFTPIEDERQHRFNKRVGFIETRRDDNFVHYRIEGRNMEPTKTNPDMVQSFQS